ncbi:MAG TPA: DUF1207 domain-containing protein [Planctomycetaceae bacterium]|nr:DUF1207 domain-containing protein [Planctomycetaceae bacterium]
MSRFTAIAVLFTGWMLGIHSGTGLYAQFDAADSEFSLPPQEVDTVFADDPGFITVETPGDSLPTFGEEWSWSVMPGGLMYKSYVAGEREPRLSTAFLQEVHGQMLWDSALGGRAGLVRFGNQSTINPEGFQLDVEGAAFVRLLPEDERDVNAVDFRAGVPLTYREGPFQAKLGYYHISSHLGDEFLIKNPGFNRINYVRDAVVAGVGYFPHPWIRTYFEVGYAVIFTSGGAKPWEVQTGFEVDSRRPTGLRGEPYFAMNIHLREEVSWGGSLNVLAGWQWRGFKTDHVFRFGLQFYNGKNAQYSLLQDNQQLIGLGVRYDY